MTPQGITEIVDAITSMNSGKGTVEDVGIIMKAATEYADLLGKLRQEWGFESPGQLSLYYASENEMLIEVMASGAPVGTKLFTRATLPWRHIDTKTEEPPT